MIYNIVIVLFFSIIQAFVSTVLAILFALPLTHFFYKFDFFGKKFFIALASVFCIMPTKLAAICVYMFYGPSIATGFTGIVLAHLMLNIAFAFYVLNLAYYKLDITLLWLAKESGAQSWRCYKDIVLPILKPTIISIFLLLFLLHFASFSIPLILGNSIIHSTPEIIIYNFYLSGDNFSALITWALRLLIVLPVFFLHNKYTKENIKASSAPIILQKKNIQLSQLVLKDILYLVCFIFILIIIFGPLIALLVKSFDKKVFDFLASIFVCIPDKLLGICLYRILINSIFLAITSALGAVLLACLICILELKLKDKYSRNIISFITVLSFIIGSVGVGIVFAYLQEVSFFSQVQKGSVLICLISQGVFFAWPFMIGFLAHVFLNYAFAYRIIRSQIVLYHPDLTKTAQALGASYKKAIFTVALPFVFPALVKAFCMSAGLSLTEVGAGAILHGKIGMTIPMAIKIYRQAGYQEGVVGLSLVLLILVLLVTCFFSNKISNQ